MSLLHTSDLHLRSVGDERWEALERLIERAEHEDVVALTIAGDLFDRDVDAEQLRPDLRALFSGNSFRVVLVSGNHDEQAFRSGLHFGENASLITDPEQPVVFEDEGIRLWGLPYEDLETGEVYERVRTVVEGLNDPDQWVDGLLYHGQLVHPDYRNEGFGEEGGGKYMPLRLNFFDGTGVDYVLAGHYHSRARSHSYDGGTFLYPGSPVPVSRSETGPRHCFLVRDGNRYDRHELDGPYYESLRVSLRPDDSDPPLQRVRRRLRALEDRARPVLSVEGYFDGRRLDMSEAELDQALQKELGESADYDFRARDVGGILSSELYGDFEQRLSERSGEDSPDEELVRGLVLEAMMRAGMTHAAD